MSCSEEDTLIDVFASDKENSAPASQATVHYPELPRLSPAKRPTENYAQTSPAKKQQGRQPFASLQASTPANTSRRRTAATKVADLASTPPRQSHAEKLKGIFEFSHKFPTTATDSASSSSLTSESELEKRILSSPSLSGHGSPMEVDRDQDRVSELPPTGPKLLQGELVTSPQQEESSSASWTGDDEFIPRSVRRRNFLRAKYKQKQEIERRVRLQREMANGARLSIVDAHHAMQLRETRALLGMTPVSPPKSSRFRRGDGEGLAREELQREGLLITEDDRPSDGDDEAESDDPDR